MAKNLEELAAALKNLNKSAAKTPEDPAIAGTKTEISADVDLAKPAGDGAGIIANVPEITKEEPAGEAKSPEGAAVSEVPGAKPFVENGGKLANLSVLRDKLANFGKETTPAPAKAAAEATDVAPGFSTHMIVNALLKSAHGRQVLEDGLVELYGDQKAQEMVKSAAADFESFEVAMFNEKIAALDQAQAQAEAEQEYARQRDAHEALLKTASSDEEREKLKTSYFLLKRAEASVIDNQAAHNAFTVGAILGEKIAAAMDPAMMQDPAAMEAMMGEQMGGAPEGEPAPEEIIAALEELVQTQQITPEQAQEILEAVLGGEGGMPAGPEAMPPGMEDMPKEAAEKLIASVDQHLEKVAQVVTAAIEA